MSEEDTNKNASLQKGLLPGHDPGWNDPPKWAYSGGQSSVTPTKRLLNKRVAFPLAPTQAANKDPASNKPLNMPPPVESSVSLTTASHAPMFQPSNVEERSSEMLINKNEILNNVLTNLETAINEHISEKNRAEEVKKRLDILKATWLEDKLDDAMCKNILNLSTALREGNVEKADEIHIALMMKHATLCSAWIPGIRHIILGLKTKMQSSSVIQSQNPELALLPVEENK